MSVESSFATPKDLPAVWFDRPCRPLPPGSKHAAVTPGLWNVAGIRSKVCVLRSGWHSIREIEALDRPDLYPYLQLDLDVPKRVFTVWEGDMCEG